MSDFSNQRDSIKCAFCGENHKSKDCEKYSDTSSRIQIVKDKRLCFNCLRNHQVAKCASKTRCQHCKKKHHTSICNTRRVEMKNVRDESRSDTAVLNSFTCKDNQGVLLKTAISTVSSGVAQTDAHILFDEGAQKSFITESLANELKLQRTGTETVHLATFSEREEKLQHLDTAIVHLLADRKESIPIRVLIVPSIATPLGSCLQHTASRLPYLRGLKLAHPVTGDQTFNISMLIGADHYWDIVQDRVIRGKGPTAVQSKVGYLLSGPLQGAKTQRSSVNNLLNCIVKPAHVSRSSTRHSASSQTQLPVEAATDSLRRNIPFPLYKSSYVSAKKRFRRANLCNGNNHHRLHCRHGVCVRDSNVASVVEGDPSTKYERRRLPKTVRKRFPTKPDETM